MRRDREIKYAVIVGAFTLVVLMILSFLLIWKSMFFLRVSGYSLSGSFDSVGGLLTQAEVRYRGYKIGKVSKITPKKEAVIVDMLISNDVKIPKDSTTRVVFDGLVGEKYVDVIPNPKSEGFLKEGAVLYGYSTAGIADFVDIGTQNLDEFKEILQSVKKIMTNKNIQKSIEKSIFSIASITNNTDQILMQVRAFSEGENLKRIMRDFDALSSRLNDSINKDFFDDLNETMNNLNSVSLSLKELFDDKEFKKDVKGAVKEGKSMFSSFDSVFGPLGSLQFTTGMMVHHNLEESRQHINGLLNIWMDNSFLRLGIGHKTDDDLVMHIQQGLSLTDSLYLRYGLFYSNPGLGFDFNYKNFFINTDIYNFNVTSWDAYIGYLIFKNIALSVGALDITNNNDAQSFLLGVSFFSNYERL